MPSSSNTCATRFLNSVPARKREKVTQQELAQRVGTNKSYISRIENGSVEPGAGMFLRILSALGLRFEVSQPLAFG